MGRERKEPRPNRKSEAEIPSTSFRRINRRFVALGAGLLGVGSLAVFLLLPTSEPPEALGDPTRFGPVRTLVVTTARIERASAGLALHVRGETNLIDGSILAVLIEARGQPIQSFEATVEGGSLVLRVAGSGEVLAGDYSVRVRFQLENQTKTVQKALHYQPRRLESVKPLVLPELPPGHASRGRFKSLFDLVNRAPRDAKKLADLDRLALELGRSLWIAEQRVAIRKLRLAIEVARRKKFERQEFDRLLLEAHVLGGL